MKEFRPQLRPKSLRPNEPSSSQDYLVSSLESALSQLQAENLELKTKLEYAQKELTRHQQINDPEHPVLSRLSQRFWHSDLQLTGSMNLLAEQSQPEKSWSASLEYNEMRLTAKAPSLEALESLLIRLTTEAL